MQYCDVDVRPRRSTGGFTLVPLEEEDRPAPVDAAGDPGLWAAYPARDRWRAEVFDGYFGMLLTGGGTLVLRDSRGRVLGCSRYHVGLDAPEDIAIGFTFLIRAHWGGATNGLMKSMMLDHALQTRERVWLYIDPTNIRSQCATETPGAAHIGTELLDPGSGSSRWMRHVLRRGEA